MVDPQGTAQAGQKHQVKNLLEELAENETEQLRKQQRAQEDFARRGEILAVEVPALFLRMAAALREGVVRFNSHLGPGVPELRFTESPAVTVGQVGPNAECFVIVQRLRSSYQLVLRYLARNGKPDLPIIEAYGEFTGQAEGVRKVLVRVEGWIEGGKTTYWVSLDFKRRDIDPADLPERIVLSVIRHDPALLGRDLAPSADRSPPEQT